MASRYPERLSPSGAVSSNMRRALGRIAVLLVALVMVIWVIALFSRGTTNTSEPPASTPGTGVDPRP